MLPEKREQVFAQYIDQYLPIIERTLEALRSNAQNLHIPYGQFLFSVIEYFGLLYAASQGKFNKKSPSNFIDFFGSEFFPEKDRCKNKFLWFIRNGLMHQIFSKCSGVSAIPSVEKLFYSASGDEMNITLNLSYLDRILQDAIRGLVENFKSDTEMIENLHSELIVNHYGLDDHNEFNEEVFRSFEGNTSRILNNC